MQQEKVVNRKICAVIPAHNEAETIGRIILDTRKYIDTVFVVDNNSTDNTAEVSLQSGAEVISCCEKQGYGTAQHTGHVTAIDKGFDYLLQLDADGQHDPRYIPALLETALNGDCDIVLGSRFLNNNYKSLPFVRRIGIIFFSKAVSLLGHTKVTDVTSGFKVYKVGSLKKLSRPSDVHPAVEQMLEIAKKGMKIGEVPVEMPARKTGESHLSFWKYSMYPFRGLWSIFKVILFK
jgi:glycosyltransferase involved in cell wall biosynthesis